MVSFINRLPVWALGVIAVVVLGTVGTVGYFVYKPARVAVTTTARACTNNNPSEIASLFSDGETTMIRLSHPDYTDMRVLRTEPANVLPGMFQALVSLSDDSARLAYVTASDELLDDAHVEYIDPTNPANRIDLATVPKGMWTVQPAWSADHRKLAYVTLDQSGGAPGQFELWVADTTTQPATVAIQADLVADNFTNGQSASICWTKDNRVVLVPSNPLTLLPPVPTTGGASPTASPSPRTGSPCGVPIFSQNDPAWRSTVMKSQSDTIGGAGCALTSAAMMLNYYGSSLTPVQLNTCLGANADPVAWKSVPDCTDGIVGGGDKIDFTWTDLDALLAAGRPAIVGMLGGQQGSHFVVVTQGGGGVADNYKITDPWDATTYKTLGGYINDGYNPAWIISFTGAGHNCGRLIKGVVPGITGIQDGGATKSPVTINIAPNLKNLKFLGILQLSSGSILKDTFNLPLPFTKITNGTTITDEGIYQVLVTTQAPSQPPRFQLYRFTIDKTPPSVDLTLLNPRSSRDAEGSLGPQGSSQAGTPPTYPLVNKPASIQVASKDTLSGIKDIKYSLDGAALSEYSSDNSFNRVLTVDACFNHSFRIQALDAAGNTTDVTKYFTVYCYVPPSPSPIPTHAPPPPPAKCTTALVYGYFTATGELPGTVQTYIIVAWSFSGGCPPYNGTITDTYSDVTGAAHPQTFTTTSLASKWTDNFSGCGNSTPRQTVVFTMVFSDSVGHSYTERASATVC